MIRRIYIGIVIFFGALLINISALAFQQRSDRREGETGDDPFAIELTDNHALKLLRNVFFWEFPVEDTFREPTMFLYDDNKGPAIQYHVDYRLFATCQLKFLLIEYLGYYVRTIPDKTIYYSRAQEIS